MSNDAWQLSLVVVGGAVALLSSLLTTLLTSRLADRKAQREKLERIHELRGRRRAVLGAREDDDVFRDWFRLNASDPARVAFMRGFLEKNNEQVEAATEETAMLKAEIAQSQAQTERMRAETKLVEERIAHLKKVHAVLAARLEQAEQEVEQRKRAPDDAATLYLPKEGL